MKHILEYNKFNNDLTEELDIKNKALSNNTFLKAPNGKETNLTEKQWLQVRTSNFKKWFGDWENDPKNASKILDENEEPLVVYHGSRYKFDIFDNSKLGESTKTARVGFWFADTKNFAKNFADSVWYGDLISSIVYDVYLNIRNPKIYKSIENNEKRSILYQEIENIKDEIYSIQTEWSFRNPTCSYDDIKVYQLAMDGKSINNDNKSYYEKRTPKSKDAIKDGEKTLELQTNLKTLENEYYNYVYSDAYEQFRTDIYKIEGKNAEIANIGGLGMALNNTNETINKYLDNLKNDGFDGIIIKDTRFDKNTAGKINNQYVGLTSNQIKSATDNNGNFNPNTNSILESYDYNRNRSKYLNWKRKNVTIRGISEIGSDNNGGAMLGDGLYTAYLSNKELTKQYGKVYFLVNARPKNPKKFNTLNEWEIWFGNTLVVNVLKEHGVYDDYPDKRAFFNITTIKDEMMKLGYDGVDIKGREIVNYKPEDVMYFTDENQLENYYDFKFNI